MAYEEEKPTGLLTIMLWVVGIIFVFVAGLIHMLG